MAQVVYEGLFILDSSKYASDQSGTVSRLTKMIDDVQGEVLVSRLWEERRLAYPINGQRKGTYWLLYFRCESRKLDEINRALLLNESVLRNMIIKLHPDIADAFVSHAGGGTVEAEKTEAAAS
ncbi:MAG TPA: 30S ribosomal protein S6 [Pirellulales bacterium]